MSDLKKLVNNSAWLFALQLFSIVAPVLLMPYLSRTLGIESFGVLAFGLSYIGFVGILIDFGFDLYFPYKLSAIKNDRLRIKLTIGSIYASKTLLFLVVSVFTIAYSYFNNDLQDHKDFFALLMLPIFINMLQPNWLFAGIEKMKAITISFALGRILYCLTIVFFVKDNMDLNNVIVLLALTQLIGVLYAFVQIQKIGLLPIFPAIKDVINTLKEASEYFYSRAAVAVYTVGGGLFLGIVSTREQVAIYYAAEQIYKGLQSVASPVTQSLYPLMIRTQNLNLFKWIIISVTVVAFLIGILGAVFSRDLIYFLFGTDFEGAVDVLMCFLIAFCINVPSVMLGYPFLGALGYATFVNKSVITAGVIQSIVLCSIYVFKIENAVNVSISLIVAEAIVFISRSVKSRFVLTEKRALT